MGTIIGRITEKSTEKSSDKTTCISITAETYKCIDISAFVPQCVTITSNVPTSELYQEQYDRDDVEITDAPILEIILINNEAPVLNVNLDAEGMVYVTDFDVVYIKITNWDANVDYVNLFSNEDGWFDTVVYLDEAEERIVWALDDYAFEGTQMWFYAQAKASDKLISTQSNVTVMQMEQTDQPSLSSWVSQGGNSVLDITILDYDATYTYSEPIVTGGTAVRTDNIIAWTLPDVKEDTNHEISITATAPLKYESLAGVSGGTVFLAYPVFVNKSRCGNITISGVGFTSPCIDAICGSHYCDGYHHTRVSVYGSTWYAAIYIERSQNTYPETLSGYIYCNGVRKNLPIASLPPGYATADVVVNYDGTYTYTTT